MTGPVINRFLSAMNEHEDHWGLQNHKQCTWKVCVLHTFPLLF